MLVGGFIERWNVMLDFDNKKVGLNFQNLAPYLQKLIYAYPYRLKKLFLFRLHPKNQTVVSELSNLLKSDE